MQKGRFKFEYDPVFESEKAMKDEGKEGEDFVFFNFVCLVLCP
jgi:hypothetical protein